LVSELWLFSLLKNRVQEHDLGVLSDFWTKSLEQKLVFGWYFLDKSGYSGYSLIWAVETGVSS